MKKKVLCSLMMCFVVLCLGACGKKQEDAYDIKDAEGYIEIHSKEPDSNSGSHDTWNGQSVKPSESTEESIEPSTEPVEESVEPSTEESSVSESSSETVEPSEEKVMYSEDDLVRVVIPEANKGIVDLSYNTAQFRVDGDVTVNTSIDYGISLDSDLVRELITLIYEGTGCTSHTVLEEYFAIFEDDEYDYSAYIELSDGSKYGIYLIGDKCYAIKDEF